MREKEFHEFRDKLIFLWFLQQFFQMVYIVSAWAFVNDRSSHGQSNDSVISVSEISSHTEPDDETYDFFSTRNVELFNLCWFTLVSLIYSMAGFLIGKYRRTKIALGFFVGANLTMANWTLPFAVRSGHLMIEKKYNTNSDFSRAYVEAAALSSLLLSILYGIFGVLLLAWSDYLVELSPLEKKVYEQMGLDEDEDDICTSNITILTEPDNRMREDSGTFTLNQSNSLSDRKSTTGESVVQS